MMDNSFKDDGDGGAHDNGLWQILWRHWHGGAMVVLLQWWWFLEGWKQRKKSKFILRDRH